MLNSLFEISGFFEVFVRRVLYKFPSIKNNIKKKIKKNTKEMSCYKQEAWELYKSTVHDKVQNDDIVLIHSSLDGLSNMGISISNVLELIHELIARNCTVVLPAYPVTNLKITNNSMKVYDPLKTPCWTGMLPNAFLKIDGVIRSTIPYNSLAAVGPHAKKMMENDVNEQYVYGENSPWHYCVKYHAKILFIGTTPNDSNTIQTHMLADYMKGLWPIENWYEEISAPVRINGEIIDRKIWVQRVFWTQFVADRYINAILRKRNVVAEMKIEECPLGIVHDSLEMVDLLIELCNKGKMTYIVPKKYFR